MQPVSGEARTVSTVSNVLRRFTALFGLWLILSLGEPSAWIIGLLAAAAATAISLRLLPPRQIRVTWSAAIRFAPAFAWASLLGGIDVAWRVFQPRLPIKPRWIAYPVRLPPGGTRVFFGDDLSLVPGTLAAGGHGDVLYVHCLDGDQPVEAQIAAEEERIARSLGLRLENSHG
jgi:multicomponent Na+:H+ antiporter subunit E